jgi:(4-O-methyl)-D-glucuronate---lignin esterase
MAAVAAGSVYKLLEKQDLGTTEMPPVETAPIEGDLACQQHNGGHTDALNWRTLVIFASCYLKTSL